MPPEEDARAILRLALRHEHSLAASLDPAFAQENWGFLAQQCVENLLKGLIVVADRQPPLTHDLGRLQLLADTQLPEELLALQDFAVKARYSPEDTPLPAPRVQLLKRICQLRLELERLLEAGQDGAAAAEA
jgi:HEPN domain-containing protein